MFFRHPSFQIRPSFVRRRQQVKCFFIRLLMGQLVRRRQINPSFHALRLSDADMASANQPAGIFVFFAQVVHITLSENIAVIFRPLDLQPLVADADYVYNLILRNEPKLFASRVARRVNRRILFHLDDPFNPGNRPQRIRAVAQILRTHIARQCHFPLTRPNLGHAVFHHIQHLDSRAAVIIHPYAALFVRFPIHRHGFLFLLRRTDRNARPRGHNIRAVYVLRPCRTNRQQANQCRQQNPNAFHVFPSRCLVVKCLY